MRLSLLLIALASGALHAQERIDTLVNRRIREEGMQRSRVFQTAQVLTESFGGRLAGSPEYKAAAAWARDLLTTFGASNAALEPWGKRGLGWTLRRYSAEVTSPHYFRLHVIPKAWSRPIAGTAHGTPLLLATKGGRPDTAQWKGKLRGRIVMLGVIPDTAGTTERFTPGARRFTDAELDSMAKITDPGEPKDYWEDFDGWDEALKQTELFKAWLAREGVAAVLQASPNELTLTATAYNSYFSPTVNNVPAFIVARGDYRRLQVLLGRKLPVNVELSLKATFPGDDSTGYNVIAELPGTDPGLKDEVVMVGGHFDSWHAATGATDNAAGSAVAMEVIRILKAIDARPRRTIRVALWDGEEQEDYFGSMGYVKTHFGDPVTMTLKPAHATLSAYFNVDHGTGRVRGLYLQGNTALRPVFAQLLEPFRDLGASTLSIANYGQTDHMPFVSVGLPGINVIQDPIDYEPRTHHTGLDGSGFLIEDNLKQVAVVVASLVYHTANRDGRLPRMPLPQPRPAKK